MYYEQKSPPVLLCMFARNETKNRYPDALTLVFGPRNLRCYVLCSFARCPTLLPREWRTFSCSSLPSFSTCLWLFACLSLSSVVRRRFSCCQVSVRVRVTGLQSVPSTDARKLVGSTGGCFLASKMSLEFLVDEADDEEVAEEVWTLFDRRVY
jgi:hypothetical protein